jgi:predicted nucleotidyltransferase
MGNLDPKIKEKLQELGVSLVYIFGSSAENLDRSDSDVDIGVVFKKMPPEGAQTSRVYNRLYDVFTGLFPGKKVDIVFLERANLELRFDAISHGKIIFETSPEARFNFEEKNSILYADFRPYLNEFNRAILDRL